MKPIKRRRWRIRIKQGGPIAFVGNTRVKWNECKVIAGKVEFDDMFGPIEYAPEDVVVEGHHRLRSYSASFTVEHKDCPEHCFLCAFGVPVKAACTCGGDDFVGHKTTCPVWPD